MDTSTVTCDVAVVGGGFGGLTTALRAGEAGLRARVFERQTDDRYVCNSRITTGVFHVAMNNPMADADELAAIIERATDGTGNPLLARAMATEGRAAIRWLQGLGIRFIKGGAEAYHNFVLAPPANNQLGRQWQGRGGDVLMRTLEAALVKHGGGVERGHAVDRLRIDAGRVVGLEGTRTVDGRRFTVTARAVVLADGGFQADFERIARSITPSPERVVQRNTRTGRGDGLRMAEAIGAAASDLRGFYGHVLARDALTDDRLWPYPWIDELCRHSIVVAADGRRFVDEGQGGIVIANAIAALADPASTTVVFDRDAWEGPAQQRFLPTNPTLPDAGGTVYEAATLDELARKAGLPSQALAEEVARHNAAVDAGDFSRTAPPRSVARFAAMPIRRAPFRAIPLAAGLTYTMGGVLIDEHARVLDRAGQPIAGLYAAGSTTGGLEGGPRCGYVGGLAKAAVTGMLAASHLAALLREDAKR